MHAWPVTAYLVFPEQRTKIDLISWERVVADLEGRPEEEQSPVLQAFLPFALDHPDLVTRLQIENATKSGGSSRLRMALLGAVMADCLTVFAGQRGRADVYETHPALWRSGFPHIANPVTLLLCGRFVPVSALLPAADLEAELAGADLYVKKSEFKKVTRLRGGSEAGIRRKAREIVDEFSAQFPGDRMINEEMREQLRRHFPGASKRALDRAIAEAKPAKWAERGRRRRRR